MTRKKKTKSISGTLQALSKATKKANDSRQKQDRREKPRQKSTYEKHLEQQRTASKGQAAKATKPTRTSQPAKPIQESTAKTGRKPASTKSRPATGKPSSPWTSLKDKNTVSSKVKSKVQKADKPPKSLKKANDELVDDHEPNMDDMSGEELFDLFDKGDFKL